VKILIDTNSYSQLYKGDRYVERMLSRSTDIFLSAISLGELYLGFLEGTKKEENLSFLKKFLNKPGVSILKVNKSTSSIYAKVKFDLRRKGTLIPENDIWIAALAIESDSVLVSYDKHFSDIPGLRLWQKLD